MKTRKRRWRFSALRILHIPGCTSRLSFFCWTLDQNEQVLIWAAGRFHFIWFMNKSIWKEMKTQPSVESPLSFFFLLQDEFRPFNTFPRVHSIVRFDPPPPSSFLSRWICFITHDFKKWQFQLHLGIKWWLTLLQPVGSFVGASSAIILSTFGQSNVKSQTIYIMFYFCPRILHTGPVSTTSEYFFQQADALLFHRNASGCFQLRVIIVRNVFSGCPVNCHRSDSQSFCCSEHLQ